MGNLCQKGPLLIHLGINVQLPAHILHQGFLVICIVDGKIGVISQIVNVSAQDPHAGRMEGRHPDALGTKSHQLVHTFSHLLGCLVGKSDSKDVPWIDPHLFHQVGDSVSQHSGLA